jgi:hypothetical protein
LGRRLGDVVERTPVAFLPNHPRDEQYKGVKASPEGFRNGSPRLLPPVRQLGGSGRSQVLAANSRQQAVPNLAC